MFFEAFLINNQFVVAKENMFIGHRALWIGECDDLKEAQEECFDLFPEYRSVMPFVLEVIDTGGVTSHKIISPVVAISLGYQVKIYESELGYSDPDYYETWAYLEEKDDLFIARIEHRGGIRSFSRMRDDISEKYASRAEAINYLVDRINKAKKIDRNCQYCYYYDQCSKFCAVNPSMLERSQECLDFKFHDRRSSTSVVEYVCIPEECPKSLEFLGFGQDKEAWHLVIPQSSDELLLYIDNNSSSPLKVSSRESALELLQLVCQ